MINKYNIIYILTPSQLQSGGAEALFQLADAINLLNGNAITYFIPQTKSKIPDSYKRYKIKSADKIDDSESNLIIVPEIWTEYLNKFTKIKKGIWWLSVDNNFDKFTNFEDVTINHFCQSNYSYTYLKANGCKHLFNLFDYLNDDFFSHWSNNTPKQDFVCYNPKKGSGITEKIISLLPEVCFVPIKNMSTSEVIEVLKKSKVYIDFGNHPGKDRIPREAVIFYNCIITSNIGAAKNEIDIPISKGYKFEENQLYEITSKIQECLINHENIKHDFDSCRIQIWNQKEEFFNQVKQLFL